jgi:hypothetical protein
MESKKRWENIYFTAFITGRVNTLGWDTFLDEVCFDGFLLWRTGTSTVFSGLVILTASNTGLGFGGSTFSGCGCIVPDNFSRRSRTPELFVPANLGWELLLWSFSRRSLGSIDS